MILPITLTIAGAAALLSFWLAWRVARVRIELGVLIGDGGKDALTARMRAHSNFVEYTPLFLILLGLVELAVGSAAWLWIVAILFVVGRILHAFGMDRQTMNVPRQAGMALTQLPLVGLGIYAIVIAYGHADERGGEMTLIPAAVSRD